jgi:hypothetical protein
VLFFCTGAASEDDEKKIDLLKNGGNLFLILYLGWPLLIKLLCELDV